MDDFLKQYVDSFDPYGVLPSPTAEDKWLDEVDELRRLKPPTHYFNDRLGTPKYDNGLDNLFKRGLSPQEALDWWKKH